MFRKMKKEKEKMLFSMGLSGRPKVMRTRIRHRQYQARKTFTAMDTAAATRGSAVGTANWE